MSVLVASGVGVRRRRHWLFQDLDVTVGRGELAAVIGPPGSGRTTALLALARHFKISAGSVTVDGVAALGHVPDVAVPEGVFTVAEHVRERLALLGQSRAGAATVDLRGLDPQRRGRDLSPYEKQVLGVVLALLADPAVIALDGIDSDLTHAEQERLWSLLDEVAAGGVAIVVTAREVHPARVDRVIDLTPVPARTPAPEPMPAPVPVPAPAPEPMPAPAPAPAPEPMPAPVPVPAPEMPGEQPADEAPTQVIPTGSASNETEIGAESDGTASERTAADEEKREDRKGEER